MSAATDPAEPGLTMPDVVSGPSFPSPVRVPVPVRYRSPRPPDFWNAFCALLLGWAVTVQTGSKLEAFFATMRSFVFFAKNPSCTAFGGA